MIITSPTRDSSGHHATDTPVKSEVSYSLTYVEIIFIPQSVPITKMSINLINGQHQLVYLYKGNNTPDLDVLQVINIINSLFYYFLYIQELCGLIHLNLELQFELAL